MLKNTVKDDIAQVIIVFVIFMFIIYLNFYVFRKDPVDMYEGDYQWTRRSALDYLGDLPRSFEVDITDDQTMSAPKSFEEIKKEKDAAIALVRFDEPSDINTIKKFLSEDELFRESIKSGSIQIIKELRNRFSILQTDDELNDHIENVKKKEIKRNKENNEFSILSLGCYYGNLGIVKYIKDVYGQFTDEDIRDYGCLLDAYISGNKDLILYLKEEFKLTKKDFLGNDFEILEECITKEKNDLFIWSLGLFGISREDIISVNTGTLSNFDYCSFLSCCLNNNFVLAKKLYEKYKITRKESLNMNYSGLKGSSHNHEFFAWFIDTFYITLEDIMNVFNYVACKIDKKSWDYQSVRFGKDNLKNTILKNKKIDIELLKSIVREDNKDTIEFINGIYDISGWCDELNYIAREVKSDSVSRYLRSVFILEKNWKPKE